jgi:hypothetical protein
MAPLDERVRPAQQSRTVMSFDINRRSTAAIYPP